MSRTGLMLALPLAALAACGEPKASVAEQNKERAEAAAATLPDNMLKPGRWETKTRITALTGASAETRSQATSGEASLDQCLPNDEARRPDANFFAGGDGSECEYKDFAMRGGKIEAVMSCTATPGSISLVIDGSYTGTSYALDATATTIGVPGAPMKTNAKLSGTWLGPCGDPAKQRAPEERAL